MNDLVGTTDAAMDILVEACLEIGHGPAPPLANGDLEDVTMCLSCRAPWPCPPVSKIIAAERAMLVALQTLGADEAVRQGVPEGDRRPCSRGREQSPLPLSARAPHGLHRRR